MASFLDHLATGSLRSEKAFGRAGANAESELIILVGEQFGPSWDFCGHGVAGDGAGLSVGLAQLKSRLRSLSNLSGNVSSGLPFSMG